MILTYVKLKRRSVVRRAAAAVELACMLPILIFCTMAAVDFARVGYVQVTLQNCARNGALFEFYQAANVPLPAAWTATPLTVKTAINSDVPSGMTVSYTVSSSSSNNTVTVTVTTTYNLLSLGADSNLPAIPGSLTLSQSATMPFPTGATVIQ
jgi:Flp pilus assembly protein TadG